MRTILGIAVAAVLAGCVFDRAGLHSSDMAPASPDAPIAVDQALDLMPDAAPLPEGGAGDTSSDLLDAWAPDLGPVLTQLKTDDVRLWSGVSTGGPVLLWSLDGVSGSWTQEAVGPLASGEVHQVLNLPAPTAQHRALGVVKLLSGGMQQLVASRYALGIWRNDVLLSLYGPANADKRDFDLARLPAAAGALLVYSDGGSTPRYRTFGPGGWSPEKPVPIDHAGAPITTATVLWVQLVSGGSGGEVTLLYADENADLGAVRWSGGAWDAASPKLLTTDLRVHPDPPHLVENRAFDGAYARSGQLLVAWGVESAPQAHYASREPGGEWSTPQVLTPAPINGHCDFVDLAADPTPASYRVAAAFVDYSGSHERLGLAMWQGGSWADVQEVDDMRKVNESAQGDFPAAVAWVGHSGKAVCVYADNTSGTLDWFDWQGSGWTKGVDLQLPGKGDTESVLLRSFATRAQVLAVLSDNKANLFAALFDGSSWQASGGGALTGSVARQDALPFWAAVQP